MGAKQAFKCKSARDEKMIWKRRKKHVMIETVVRLPLPPRKKRKKWSQKGTARSA